jgi:hypothetical protein
MNVANAACICAREARTCRRQLALDPEPEGEL